MKLSEKELFMGPILPTKSDKEITNYFKHIIQILERNVELSNNSELKKDERD